MSKKFGRIIMILGIVICVLAFGTCMALSLSYFANKEVKSAVYFGVAWAIMGGLSLLATIPFILVGKLATTLDTHSKKIKSLTDKMSKLEGCISNQNEYSQYSPSARTGTTTITNGYTASTTIETGTKTSTRENFALGETQAIMRTAVTNGEYTKTIQMQSDPKQPTGEFSAPTSLFNRVGGNGSLPSNDETAVYDNQLSSRTKDIIDRYGTAVLDRYQLRNKIVSMKFAPLYNATIAAGGAHTVIINEDGEVEAVGDNTYGQCDVENWRGCIIVVAGMYHTIAVKDDSTCVATGFNGNKECEVSSWTSVYTVAAGKSHTVGLLLNGTCVATGDNTYGQCNVQSWNDIVAISAGETFTIGVKSDGTVLSTGSINKEQTDINKWVNIKATASGGFHTVGLNKNGQVSAYGNNANNQCEIKNWKNIKQVAAGNYHTVGLTNEGTVIAVGSNGSKQCEVGGWNNIVAIATGKNHTVGLVDDGTVVAVGDNTDGQCDTSVFYNVRVMRS